MQQLGLRRDDRHLRPSPFTFLITGIVIGVVILGLNLGWGYYKRPAGRPAGRKKPKSEIPDVSDFPFSAVSDPGTLKIGFLGKNQYRTPLPHPPTLHLVKFPAENVKFLSEITIFGLPQFPAKKMTTPKNWFSAFWRFSTHDHYAVGFVPRSQYRTPPPQPSSCHPVNVSAENVSRFQNQ